MQHTRPHTRNDIGRQQQRPSVDGFIPRKPAETTYQRRSTGILPSNDKEYMISLGSRASRRDELHLDKPSPLDSLKTIFKKLISRVNRKNYKFAHSFGVMVGVGLLVLFVGVIVVRTNNPVTANQDSQKALEDNGDTPHQNAPYNQLGYAVAPNLPKLLTIRKLGINSRVVRLSVRENSEPKYPTSIHDVGWYENSAKPGENGAALLVGHISGSEKAGVFKDLTKLVPGDEFQLELGDGTIKNYYIVKMEAYKRNAPDYASLMTSVVPGKPGLNLLTAVGAFESNAAVVQQLGVFAVEKVTSSQ